ncbi:alpha/beta fold hydrolase [Dactylosporangium sp. CA-139114]|uniref:alpha/beta fold hydrolase n=1 Tax=Dactylosporangium sp. CA-139114 TaxID=3239931 RepID=UPI003D96EDE7
MQQRIVAPDGVDIVVHTVGSGPGIVVVHGGGVTIGIYQRLANRLADRFTVHRYNRRGREDAGPRREPYTFEQDIDDLGAVLAHTGAGNVIGHSSGGFIALEAALRLPIRRLALYDAAVSIDGLFPAAWLDAAMAAARAGDTPLAMALTGAGLNTHAATSRLPLGMRIAISRLFLRTSIGRMMGGLLATTLDESNQIRLADGPATRWAAVRAEVLLAYGAAGPPYYAPLNAALADALPHARVLPVARSGHDGINRAPASIVEPLAAFFAAPVSGSTEDPRASRTSR